MIRPVALALALLSARPAAADCVADAERLRAHLEASADGVSRWNWGWAIAFSGAAVGQLALAAAQVNPLGPFDLDYRDTLYVGAVKASIGAASRIVMPLRVRIPPRETDRCDEVAHLHDAVRELATKERNTFWLTHLGGIAVNLTGGLVLWKLRSFEVGAVSFLISLPVGPLSAYTMPRATWHLYRDESPAWAVATELGAGR